ncbi:MAG TPA: response regulator, partial [Geobacteraceae bacterium]|nr:response regulator [Geobacteraceae bacterium]
MSNPLNILIVEDSEDDLFLLLHELRKGGYAPEYVSVCTADTMRSALTERQWDVITSDYNMPGFSALAALKLLQESGLDLPFIVVSGKIGEDQAVAAMKAGAHDYVMKQNLSRLVPAIEREIREADERRRRP